MMKKTHRAGNFDLYDKNVDRMFGRIEINRKRRLYIRRKNGICRVFGNHTIMGGIGKQRIGLRNRRAVSAVIDIVFIDKRHLPWYTVSDI